jgi:hypothetical protein
MGTYLLVPRDPTDIELLVEALRPAAAPGDINIVIDLHGSTITRSLKSSTVAFGRISRPKLI